MTELAKRLDELAGRLEFIANHTGDVLPEEIESACDSAAAALRSLAGQQPVAQTYGCHCEIDQTINGLPDECVFDNGDIEDCIHATKLHREKKGKRDCEYWKPIVIGAAPSTEAREESATQQEVARPHHEEHQPDTQDVEPGVGVAVRPTLAESGTNASLTTELDAAGQNRGRVGENHGSASAVVADPAREEARREDSDK